MSKSFSFYEGKRLSYDGALCTVRCVIPVGRIPETKGEWLGVEWDDPQRGKHNGVYNGQQYFVCKSQHPSIASFVRPARKSDPERSVLEAIQFKYQTGGSKSTEVVIISGKVAEEIGFDKVSKEQSVLADLRVVLIDQLCVNGIAPRFSSLEKVRLAQNELAENCPNIIELDIGHNPIEQWADVEDMLEVLKRLKVLKLNAIHFNILEPRNSGNIFDSLRELHLNECLIRPSEVARILGLSARPRFPHLHTLWLSQNELEIFRFSAPDSAQKYDSIRTLMLENNLFINLDELTNILAMFPSLKSLSLQSNMIEEFGEALLKPAIDATHLVYPSIDTLNLSMNKIQSFDFLDKIPLVFPNLTSLRISKNPFYDRPHSSTPTANASETNYYLALSRIPKLKTLNYTTITSRERDEGEIYYLSIAEKEIKSLLSDTDLSDEIAKQNQLTLIRAKYPRYEPLCQKHDRDSVLHSLTSTSTDQNNTSLLSHPPKPLHSPGSLASRLAHTTVYIVKAPPSTKPTTFTRSIPTTIPTTQLFALIARTLFLLPLQFKLIYESPELDPVRDDLTTRSQIHSSAAGLSGPERWKEWGNWDVDHLVEEGGGNGSEQGMNETMATAAAENGVWNSQGHLVKDGRKWKRREVEILMGMRAWGDYLDLEGGTGDVKLRVELSGFMLN